MLEDLHVHLRLHIKWSFTFLVRNLDQEKSCDFQSSLTFLVIDPRVGPHVLLRWHVMFFRLKSMKYKHQIRAEVTNSLDLASMMFKKPPDVKTFSWDMLSAVLIVLSTSTVLYLGDGCN